MHKQRSPFTGGGGAFGANGFNFNAQEFVETSFNSAEGLNGMPWKPQIPVRSMSRTPKNTTEGGEALPSKMDGGGVRGRRGITPRSALGEAFGGMQIMSNFNGHFEGDMTMLEGSGSTLEQNKACPLLQKMRQLSNKQDPNSLTHHSDTDSETEYCLQLKNVRTSATEETRLSRTFNCLITLMSPQRQQQVKAALQRLGQNVFFKNLLLMLLLLSTVLVGAVQQSMRLGVSMTNMRFRFWRCKFQLRSTMRHMLWRMANAKTNDTLLFLIVVLITPWLFLISLFGFAISFVYSLKSGLAEGIRQLRLRLVY